MVAMLGSRLPADLQRPQRPSLRIKLTPLPNAIRHPPTSDDWPEVRVQMPMRNRSITDFHPNASGPTGHNRRREEEYGYNDNDK